MGYNKKNKRKFVEKRSAAERMLLLAPIYFIIALIPVITRYHEFNPKLIEHSFFAYTNLWDDMFLYWKQWLFVFAVVVILCIISYRAYKDKKTLRFSKLFIPLGIYALLAFLSTIFSKYPSFGFSGIMDQFENVWCLLGYALIPYYLFLIIETEEDAKSVITAFITGIGLFSIIGLTQVFKHDIWLSDFGKSILNADIELVMGEGRAYVSQFNPNYIGTYVGFTAPILLVLLTFSKKLKEIIPYILSLTAIFIILLSSQAKSGLVGIAVSLVFFIILLRKTLIKRWYAVLAVVILALLSIMAAGKINNVNYFNNAATSIKNALKFEKRESTQKLQDIITGDDSLKILYDNNSLIITTTGDISDYQITVHDQQGKLLPYNYDADAGSFYFTDENGVIDQRFQNIRFAFVIADNEILLIEFTIDGSKWTFTNLYEDGSFYYLNQMQRLSKIETQNTSWLKGYEHIMSNRGFLWAHTIALFKDYIFLGSGADTFILAYPQYDYVNMRNHGYGQSGDLISKPHNMYLQIGVQTGVISLIAILVFYVLYFIWSICIYIKHSFDSYLPQVGVAIFIGSIAYMVVGFVNDSSITTAPVFWTLLGLGTAINFIVQEQIKKETLNKIAEIEKLNEQTERDNSKSQIEKDNINKQTDKDNHTMTDNNNHHHEKTSKNNNHKKQSDKKNSQKHTKQENHKKQTKK